MTTEEKALALVREEPGCEEWQLIDGMLIPITALCRAIEAHEADKKAFSDAITAFWPTKPAPEHFQRFILPEPDPLVEALKKADTPILGGDGYEEMAERFRSALAERGWKMNLERIEQ